MDRETRSRQYTIGDRLTNIIISIFLGIFICAVALIYYVFSSIIKGIEKLNKPAKW
jgi:flagellar basal body-associated protein FliL